MYREAGSGLVLTKSIIRLICPHTFIEEQIDAINRIEMGQIPTSKVT